MARIVLLTTVHPRSDTRVFIKEAQSLAAGLPHEVILMVADGLGHVEKPRGQVSVHDIGRLPDSRIGRALGGQWRALRAVSKLRPDVVHFHDPELVPLGMLLRALGYKVLYDVHEDVPAQILSKHYLPRPVRGPLAWVTKCAERLGAMTYNGIVPATPKIAERFPPAKTVAVCNYPIIDELQPRRPVPYAERPPAFAYVGVVGEVRGAEQMVLALELSGEGSDVRLELAGRMAPREFGEMLRARPGWGRVNYHGEVDRGQVAELLGGCRAGLVVLHPVPNKVEALPIKLFEYMSAGLPVIASEFSTLRAVIAGADCGLLVPPLDAPALAEAMRWILDHPVEAEAMGKRGRGAVERVYNWRAEAGKLVELFDKLLSS